MTEAAITEILTRFDILSQRLTSLEQSVESHHEYFESLTGRMMATTERVRSNSRDDLERLRSDLEYSIDSLRREVENVERQSRYCY